MALAGHCRQIFFSARLTFLPLFLDIVTEQPQEDPPTQQANPRSRGRSSGIPNYCSDILINIVKEQLPQGLEAWRNVACLYQSASNENELRRGEDIRDNWVRKLCNNFKKPTGKPGDLTDRIYRCLAIERRIQRKASAAILGASSGESSNENDHGSKDSDNFSFGGGGVYDDEVAVANAPRNDDASEPVDDDAYEEQLDVANVGARSPALPNFIGSRPAVMTTVARRVGGQGGCGDGQGGGSVNPAPGVSTADEGHGGWFCQSNAREEYSTVEESKFNCEQQGGGGSKKLKNSTNPERGSISKVIDRMAESIVTGGASEDSGMMTMLSNQMNQQSMQQQMFQQSLKMQMAALEKKVT